MLNNVNCNVIVKVFIRKANTKYRSVLNRYLSKFYYLNSSAEYFYLLSKEWVSGDTTKPSKQSR